MDSEFSKPKSDSEYFENLVRAVFVVGFSRKVVDDKWEGFREVFDNFDFHKVAKWGQADILDAVERPEIIRNLKKIEATVHNAQIIEDVLKEHESFHSYIRSMDDLDFDTRVKKLSKPFKWLGPTATKIFLYTSGEPVPSH